MPSANEAAQFLEINNLLIKKNIATKKKSVDSGGGIHFLAVTFL
jgi:hypothetical protein